GGPQSANGREGPGGIGSIRVEEERAVRFDEERAVGFSPPAARLPAAEFDEGLEVPGDAVEEPTEIRRRQVLLHVARIERSDRIEEPHADRRAILPDPDRPRRAEVEALEDWKPAGAVALADE